MEGIIHNQLVARGPELRGINKWKQKKQRKKRRAMGWVNQQQSSDIFAVHVCVMEMMNDDEVMSKRLKLEVTRVGKMIGDVIAPRGIRTCTPQLRRLGRWTVEVEVEEI